MTDSAYQKYALGPCQSPKSGETSLCMCPSCSNFGRWVFKQVPLWVAFILTSPLPRRQVWITAVRWCTSTARSCCRTFCCWHPTMTTPLPPACCLATSPTWPTRSRSSRRTGMPPTRWVSSHWGGDLLPWFICDRCLCRSGLTSSVFILWDWGEGWGCALWIPCREVQVATCE